MVLLQNRCVFCEQSLLLLFHNGGLVLFLSDLGVALGQFDGTLLSEDGELLLPEALHLSPVLLFAHAALLLGHLLEPLVLGEFSKQLLLEVLFEALFFGGTFGLQAHLEVLGLLKFATGVLLFGNCVGLALTGCKLVLLVVELVAEVFTELSLLTASHLLSLEFFENRVASGFSLIFGGLNLV